MSLHPNSAALYARAVTVFPSGVTHDVRYLKLFPIFVERASGKANVFQRPKMVGRATAPRFVAAIPQLLFSMPSNPS